MIKKLLITFSLFLTLFASNSMLVAQAYEIDPSFRPRNAPLALDKELDTKNIDNKEEREKVPVNATILVLQILSGAMLYFAAPLAVIFLALAGLNMVVNSSEPEKLDESKKNITWTIAGLLLIILSYSVVRIVLTIVISSASALE
jgi:hypothetical protein